MCFALVQKQLRILRRAHPHPAREVEASMQSKSLSTLGSTGDSPVPSGDPPDGTGVISNVKKTAFLHPNVDDIPPGGPSPRRSVVKLCSAASFGHAGGS